MVQFNHSKKDNIDHLYQRQKIYIENLTIKGSLEAYEREFKLFLSKYGTIIDIKILKNRKLKR